MAYSYENTPTEEDEKYNSDEGGDPKGAGSDDNSASNAMSRSMERQKLLELMALEYDDDDENQEPSYRESFLLGQQERDMEGGEVNSGVPVEADAPGDLENPGKDNGGRKGKMCIAGFIVMALIMGGVAVLISMKNSPAPTAPPSKATEPAKPPSNSTSAPSKPPSNSTSAPTKPPSIIDTTNDTLAPTSSTLPTLAPTLSTLPTLSTVPTLSTAPSFSPGQSEGWSVNKTIVGSSEAAIGNSIEMSLDGTRLIYASPPNFKFYELDGDSYLEQDISDSITFENETNSNSAISLSGDGNVLAISYSSDNYSSVTMYNASQSFTRMGDPIEYNETSPVSISLSDDGDKVLIGYPESTINGVNSGLVRYYDYHDNTWERHLEIEGQPDDEAGYSVGLSGDGDTFAVGSPGNSENTGDVTIYHANTNHSSYQQTQRLLGDDNKSRMGLDLDVSTNGDRIAIGGVFSSNSVDYFQCQIYHHDNGTVWEKFGSSVGGDNVADGAGTFGEQVSISGDGIVVAMSDPYGRGSVRVYTSLSGDWQEMGKKIEGEFDGDEMGSSLTLSSDGSKLAIVAKGVLSDNGTRIGSVYVYVSGSIR